MFLEGTKTAPEYHEVNLENDLEATPTTDNPEESVDNTPDVEETPEATEAEENLDIKWLVCNVNIKKAKKDNKKTIKYKILKKTKKPKSIKKASSIKDKKLKKTIKHKTKKKLKKQKTK